MTTGATILEIERFEWITPERIELVGYWSGLRGRRFVRPTLVLKGEGGQKRLLALLDHKPWAAHDGEAWTAAFAWEGEVVRFEGAELSVGSGIDLELPSPRMRPGKPRRFRQRVVLHDASRDEQAAPTLASGIVSDSPEPEPKLSRAEALKAALPVKPKDEPEPTVALDPAAEGEPDAPAVADSAEADIDRIRREREALRRERDRALAKLRAVRGELEAERQARERAVADARAAERESANRMLGEGAELRASVERQREIAYLERDEAKAARDEAIAARDRACDERDAALAEAKDARRDRKEAFAQRDRAVKVSERAEAARAAALQERDHAVAERDTAVKERDEILRVHDRGLPVHAPKPRFLPDEHERRSGLEVWGPRVSALALLLLCALIVLRLFACG